MGLGSKYVKVVWGIIGTIILLVFMGAISALYQVGQSLTNDESIFEESVSCYLPNGRTVHMTTRERCETVYNGEVIYSFP